MLQNRLCVTGGLSMSNNPIAMQSKKWIIDALLELMNRKAYHLITVREISSKALIDRRTFIVILSVKMMFYV